MQLRTITTFIKGVLILAPPLLIGILIFKNRVNLPVLDEWNGTAPLFEKMADGTLGIADFFAQHNEHRIFFPRLIFFTLGRLTHWNIRAELWVIWFLAIGAANPLRSPFLDIIRRQRPSVQSSRRGQLSLGISNRIPPPPRLC